MTGGGRHREPLLTDADDVPIDQLAFHLALQAAQ